MPNATGGELGLTASRSPASENLRWRGRRCMLISPPIFRKYHYKFTHFLHCMTAQKSWICHLLVCNKLLRLRPISGGSPPMLNAMLRMKVTSHRMRRIRIRWKTASANAVIFSYPINANGQRQSFCRNQKQKWLRIQNSLIDMGVRLVVATM